MNKMKKKNNKVGVKSAESQILQNSTNEAQIENVVKPERKKSADIGIDTSTSEIGVGVIANFLSGRSIHIGNPINVADNLINKYKLYEISSSGAGSETTVRRRYKDFEWLYYLLQQKYKNLLIPVLPEKSLISYITGDEAEFIDIRKRHLKIFLEKLLRKEYLKEENYLYQFLALDDAKFYLYRKKTKPLKSSTGSKIMTTLKGFVKGNPFEQQ